MSRVTYNLNSPNPENERLPVCERSVTASKQENQTGDQTTTGKTQVKKSKVRISTA